MDSKDSKDSKDDDTKGSDQTGSLTDFTFDEQHDDPKADVILVSTDNVGFRIHSWTFKKRSTFIADLFDVATQGDPSQSPIHLDAASNVLRIFVNMIHSGDTPYLEIKVADYVTLLTICDRLQCPDIEKAVVSSLKLGAAKDPWAVFTLASQRNDVGLAKAALEAMGEGRSSPATRLPKLLPQDMDGVRTSFFVELIGRRLSSAYDHNCKIVHYHMVDWSTVARDFSPKV